MIKKDLKNLIGNHKPGWSLDQPFYTDPYIFSLEWQHIWSKYWLFVGISSEIPQPGNYFTYQANKDSIIIIRGDDGSIYAHHNSCRHRGSVICLEERGHAPKLMCPYHQWIYNKDGTLFKARLMPDNFDKSSFGLHPVHVAVVEGMIFISLASNPPSFKKVSRDFAPFLKPYKLDFTKVAFKKRYELRTNWKLIAENFRECYHCGPAHPEYCRAVIGANLIESAENVLTERKVNWEQKGLNVNGVNFDDDSFHFAIRYPLRPGVESYSLDGKPVSIPIGDHKDFDAGVLGMVLFPNFWMDAVSDYVWIMRISAVSPSSCIIDLYWLVDQNAVEGKDYFPVRLTEFWKITGEQDWKLCENNFKGIESSRYMPGPFAPDEGEVAQFVEWYMRRLKKGLIAEEIVNV